MYNNKKKTIVMAVMLAVIALMATGYAFFATQLNITVTGNITGKWLVHFTSITEGDNHNTTASNTMTPTAVGTVATMGVDLKVPGDKMTYELILKNGGDVPAIIESINAKGTGSGAIVYSISGIKIGDILEENDEIPITIVVEFDPRTTSQPSETSKKLTVEINAVQYTGQEIDSSNPTIDQPIDSVTTISNAILRDNTLIDGNYLDFTIPGSSYIAAYKEVHGTTEVAAYTSTVYDLPLCSSYNFDSVTGIYHLDNCPVLIYEQTVAEYVAANGGIGDNVYTCGERTMECTAMDKLVGTEGYAYLYTTEELDEPTYDSAGKIYYTSSKTEDNKTTYFFRGNVENNYVKFGKYANNYVTWQYSEDGVTGSGAEEENWHSCEPLCITNDYGKKGDDMYWRIVRINEDGSIRLVYQGTSVDTTGKYATIGPVASSYNFSYTYTSNGALTDGALKLKLERWFETSFDNQILSYFADAGFCHDRGKTGNTANAFDRLYSSYPQPQYKCSNPDDLYTTSTSSKGNKLLKYPTGILTADEAMYTGLIISGMGLEEPTQKSSYLNENIGYWLMQESDPDGYKFLGYDNTMTGAGGGYEFYEYVRPVINIKGDLLTTGKGTAKDPYVIQID